MIAAFWGACCLSDDAAPGDLARLERTCQRLRRATGRGLDRA